VVGTMPDRATRDGAGGGPDAPGEPAHVHDRLDVARLLQEQMFESAQVVSGRRHLDAEVTWCLPWEAATTTSDRLDGMVVVADSPQVMSSGARVLAALAGRGMVALFVVSQQGGTPPEGVGSSKLPVVLLPPGVDFAAVSRLVAELALSKEAHVLRYGVRVHRVLAELLYRGSGLSALARELSRLSGCPVFVLDTSGRPLAEQHQGGGASTSLLAEIVSALESTDLAPPGETDLTPGERIRMIELDIDHWRTCLISPIVLGGRHDGWVVVVELDEAPAWHEMARHRVIVEQATMIIGSEMLRLRSVEAAEERARGDFVHALLHGRFSNLHELSRRAEHYDFDVSGSYGVVVAHGFGVAGGGESLSKMLTLARRAAQILPRKNAQTLAAVVGDVLVIVRQITPGNPRQESKQPVQQIAEFASLLSRDLSRCVEREVVVAYGRPVLGAQLIVSSYEEARIALGVCERLGVTEASGYGELRVFAALLDLAESHRGRAFAAEVLAPLRGADQKGAGGLEQAVLAYIVEGGNLNAAARKLAMHRNTMLYKLDRASRELGMDLRQAENQFTVWLALRIEMLSEVRAAVSREISPTS
jgi:sugar diacid utilization regulator